MTTSAHAAPRPRTWFVTGTSTGFGRQLATAALERGDRVVATARRLDDIGDYARLHPSTAEVLAADVRDPASLERAVARATDRFGGIDVVVNNAGVGVFGGVEEVSDAQARSVFDINVFGSLNVLRATLPVLRGQRSGHVVQLSSLYGQTAHAGVGLLAATKYAVEGIADALLDELAPLGVKVTLVQPGYYATSFLANLTTADPIEDYDASVGAVRRSLGTLTPDALGDPRQAAAAILRVVDHPAPPLRLALGGQAAEAFRAGLAARLKDLDDWSPLTSAA